MKTLSIFLILVFGLMAAVSSKLETLLKELKNEKSIKFEDGFGKHTLVLGYSLVFSEDIEIQKVEQECK